MSALEKMLAFRRFKFLLAISCASVLVIFSMFRAAVDVLGDYKGSISAINGGLREFSSKKAASSLIFGTIQDLNVEKKLITQILENKKRIHASKVTVDYSILKNSYYVVQKVEDAPAPKCFSVKNKLSDYALCTLNTKDTMFAEAKSGRYAWEEILTFIRLLQSTPNAAYIDVGANRGLLLFPILAALEYERKVIAVEANPEMLRGLMAGFNVNNVPKDSYSIIQRGLADTVDENVSFTMAFENSHLPGNGALVGKVGKFMDNLDMARAFTVLTATFDSHVLPVAKAMNITTAILKMDIESSECLALKAASKFLTNIHVPYIMMEHSVPESVDACVQEMYRFLKSMGYDPYLFGSTYSEEMLDLKDYKGWGWSVRRNVPWSITNIFWKKKVL